MVCIGVRREEIRQGLAVMLESRFEADIGFGRIVKQVQQPTPFGFGHGNDLLAFNNSPRFFQRGLHEELIDAQTRQFGGLRQSPVDIVRHIGVDVVSLEGGDAHGSLVHEGDVAAIIAPQPSASSVRDPSKQWGGINPLHYPSFPAPRYE